MKAHFTLSNFTLFTGFLVFLGSGLMIYQLDSGKTEAEFIHYGYYPYQSKLKELELMLTEIELLSTSLVYISENDKNRRQLHHILNHNYPNLRSQVIDYVSNIEDVKMQNSVDEIFLHMDNLMTSVNIVHQTLKTKNDYKNLIQLFKTEAVLKSKVLPSISSIRKDLTKFTQQTLLQQETLKSNVINSFEKLRWTVFFTGFNFICMLSGGILYILRVSNR